MRNLFIFDMGNVITTNVDVLPPIAEHFSIPLDELRDVCRDEFLGLASGRITTDEFWAQFGRIFGVEADADYLSAFFEPETDPAMAGLVTRLRSEGHRVVCGTNTIESHYRVHQERGDYDIFDHVYASQLIGLVKPDPAFFRYIVGKETEPAGANFDNVVFIDDLPRNVDSAAGEGLLSFLFTGFGELCSAFDERLVFSKA